MPPASATKEAPDIQSAQCLGGAIEHAALEAVAAADREHAAIVRIERDHGALDFGRLAEREPARRVGASRPCGGRFGVGLLLDRQGLDPDHVARRDDLVGMADARPAIAILVECPCPGQLAQGQDTLAAVGKADRGAVGRDFEHGRELPAVVAAGLIGLDQVALPAFGKLEAGHRATPAVAAIV
jgi:hypothetical protein